MTEIQLLRPEGLVVSPAFSHVAVVPPGATMVYVGGQNAVDQNGELVGGTDVAAQTRQVMANLVTALQAAGAGIEHLVSVLVLLVQGVDVQAAYAAAAATLGAAEALRWSARRLCPDSASPVPWWRCPQSRRHQIEPHRLTAARSVSQSVITPTRSRRARRVHHAHGLLWRCGAGEGFIMRLTLDERTQQSDA